MLIPNSTTTPNYFYDVVMAKVSGGEWKILSHIIRQTYGWIEDPLTKRRKEKDWIAYSQLVTATGLHREAISRSLRNLEKMGYIQIMDEEGRILTTPESRRGKKLYYRVNTQLEDTESGDSGTSSKIELVTPNQFENRTSKIELTKETNTKETINKLIVIDSPAEKPIVKVSKCSNPNGHNKGIPDSCITNLEDLQREFGKKFVNFPAQIKAQHAIFKAGFTLEQMSRVANQLDKDPFWRAEGWDMITISKKLSKGGSKYGI